MSEKTRYSDEELQEFKELILAKLELRSQNNKGYGMPAQNMGNMGNNMGNMGDNMGNNMGNMDNSMGNNQGNNMENMNFNNFKTNNNKSPLNLLYNISIIIFYKLFHLIPQ